MRLAYPIFLLFLLLIPLIIWLRYLRNRHALQYSRTAELATLPSSWRIRFQPLLPLLYALGLAGLIIGLARPQRGLQKSTVHTEAIDIVLLLDLSGSMERPDFVKNRQRISRLDATKEVVGRFLLKRPDDRIGIVAFATAPYALAPLTLDHAWLIKRVEGLHINLLENSQTAIGDGIASALNRLQESEAKSRIIILLTDGENNWGTLSPENAARTAEALGIKIYTIAVSGRSSGVFNRSPPLDTTSLRKIAEVTEGKFYLAQDLETLDAVYNEIDQLEKTKIAMEQYTRYEEMAGPWILAGILLLGLEQLLGLTKLGRLP